MIRKIFSPLLASSLPVGYRVGSSDTGGIVESLDATSWSYKRCSRDNWPGHIEENFLEKHFFRNLSLSEQTSKRVFFRSIEASVSRFLWGSPWTSYEVPLQATSSNNFLWNWKVWGDFAKVNIRLKILNICPSKFVWVKDRQSGRVSTCNFTGQFAASSESYESSKSGESSE